MCMCNAGREELDLCIWNAATKLIKFGQIFDRPKILTISLKIITILLNYTTLKVAYSYYFILLDLLFPNY